MLIRSLIAGLRARFTPVARTAPPVKLQAPPHPLPPPELPTPLSAVAILDNDPNLTAAELAKRAGVTLSYARSLVRRRKAKAVHAPAVLRPAAAEPNVSVLENQVRELARRVEQTETHVLRAAATAAPKSSCRTQVLDRSAAGLSIDAISGELGIPAGETEFILKMERLKKSVKR